MIGTTIETSIRIMSRWGKQRIVLTEKDGFLVAGSQSPRSARRSLSGCAAASRRAAASASSTGMTARFHAWCAEATQTARITSAIA